MNYVDYFDCCTGCAVVGRWRVRLQPLALADGKSRGGIPRAHRRSVQGCIPTRWRVFGRSVGGRLFPTTITSFLTESDADNWIADHKAEVAKGRQYAVPTNRRSTGFTSEELVKGWIASHEVAMAADSTARATFSLERKQSKHRKAASGRTGPPRHRADLED